MYRNLSTQGLGISGVESEIIELALTNRFEGIDPDLPDMLLRIQEKGVNYAKRLIDSAKLKLGTYPLPTVWQEGEDQFRRELAKLDRIAGESASLGCTALTTIVAPASDDRPYHENFEFHRKRLAEVGTVLAKHGVSLGLEFRSAADLRASRAFEFVKSFDELRKLAEGVGKPNVGVVFDSFQWHAAGGSMDDLRSLSANQVVSVLLADVPADVPREELTEKHRLLPGETGQIDAVGLLRWLLQIGYQGPLSARPDRARFSKVGRTQIVKLIAESLNDLWKEAGLEAFLRPVIIPTNIDVSAFLTPSLN